MFRNLLTTSKQIISTGQLSNLLRSSCKITTTHIEPKLRYQSTHFAQPDTVALTLEIAKSDNQKKENRIEILKNINTQLQQQKEGRLFAVIQLCGKQFKVSTGDIILIEGYWPPSIGDRIKLDKVLVVGGQDFSIIGRPNIHTELVDVQATIIEKSLSHLKTRFRKKRRKQFMRINFFRGQHTMLRINSIEIIDDINSQPKTAMHGDFDIS